MPTTVSPGAAIVAACVSVYSVFFFSSRRRHTRSTRDWSSDVCSSDLYYKEIGMDTEIEVLDWAKVREMFRKKAIGCCIWPNIISWRPSEEWIRTSYWSKSPNHHYENEFIDRHYEMLTSAVNPQERERVARTIGDHLFDEFADIPLFWFANEVMANPKVVAEWVYPGLGAGRSTDFHVIKAAKRSA